MDQANGGAGNAVAMLLARALGVDTAHAIGFTIKCDAAGAHLTVHHVVPAARGEAAASVLERFDLVPRGATPGPSVDESVSLSTQVQTTHRPAC